MANRASDPDPESVGFVEFVADLDESLTWEGPFSDMEPTHPLERGRRCSSMTAAVRVLLRLDVDEARAADLLEKVLRAVRAGDLAAARSLMAPRR